jgi:hypothetical protein
VTEARGGAPLTSGFLRPDENPTLATLERAATALGLRLELGASVLPP